MFAIVFFRLWYLQVLSGDHYLAEANDNRVREVKVEAPRGKIVDRNGTVLVDNRPALAVQVAPDRLPAMRAERTGCTTRLGTRAGHAPARDPRRVIRAARSCRSAR